MRRYRKVGLALLTVFAIQVMASGFCVIPSVHAATINNNTSVDMQCTVNMPVPAGQEIPDCTHCTTPDFNVFSNQTSDTPTTWALVAILSILPYQADSTPGQEQPLSIVSEASPRSSSLIYQKTLRIRL